MISEFFLNFACQDFLDEHGATPTPTPNLKEKQCFVRDIYTTSSPVIKYKIDIPWFRNKILFDTLFLGFGLRVYEIQLGVIPVHP